MCAKYVIDGKSVEISGTGVTVEDTNADGECIRVHFYEDRWEHGSDLCVSMHFVKPKGSKAFQRVMKKLCPDADFYKKAECLYFRTIKSCPFFYGIEDFQKDVQNENLWADKDISGRLKTLLEEALQLAIKGIDLDKKTQERERNLVRASQEKKLADFLRK